MNRQTHLLQQTARSDQTVVRRLLPRGLASIMASTMLSGVAAFAPSTAWADEPPASPEAAPQPASNGPMGEIVVTATHRSESLQKVPISLQAFDTAKLEENHVASFADYANMLPSVSFETLGPGRSEPFFRGISVSGGQASTVGTYLDDIPITSTGSEPEVHIYDVARVEALSGPQGTLYGANSLAGTIRIITNKPVFDKLEAGMELEANKFGKGNFGGTIQGFINVPVTTNVAVRLMAFYEKVGGYINNTPGTVAFQSVPFVDNNSELVKNAYNPDTEYGGRFELSWQLAPDWLITPEITYQHLDALGSYNFDPRVGDLDVHDYSPTYLDDHWYQAELSIQGKIADFDIVSATGYFSRTYKQANDYTYYSITYDRNVATAAANGGGYPGLYYTHFTDKNGNLINPTEYLLGQEHDTKFTQETRISVPKSWPFQLTLGGFFQYQKLGYDYNYFIPGLSTALNSGVPGVYPPFSPALSGLLNNDSYYLVEEDRHFKDGAVFAEGSYNITPELKATGGIRYFVSDNGTYGFAGTWSSADAAGCWNENPAVLYNKFIHPYRLSCINDNVGYHQTGQTHKVNLTWQFEPSKMVYATYSTGFRPGGGNRLAGAAPYKADTLTNFEIGWKTRWGSNFRWNGAVYYEKWDGVQYTVIPAGTQGAGVTVNAGNARVYGVETDFEWKPITALTLSGNGAYNDARLSTNFCDLSDTSFTLLTTCSTLTTYTTINGVPTATGGGDAAALKGTRLPRQPLFKGNATARYDFGLADTKAFVQAQVFHQSGSTSDLSAENDLLLGDTAGFTTFNFSAGTTVNKVAIEAFIENAFDKRGILSKNTFCSIIECANSSRSYPIKPQFFGLRASYKY